MNAKSRWYEILLFIPAVFLFLMASTVQTTTAYEYLEYETPYYDDSEDYDRGDSTYWETADSDGDADSGSCSCEADTYAYSKGNSASADADAYGTWVFEWAWNGPPGVAPGGTLSWSLSGGGTVGAWGYSSAQGAGSSSDGDSGIWSSGTEGSSYADTDAWGYSQNGTSVGGGISDSASPSEDFTEGTEFEYDTPPNYSFYHESWSFSTSDDESIGWGTTYVYFAGGADCSSWASASSGITGEWAQADGESDADASVSASFP